MQRRTRSPGWQRRRAAGAPRAVSGGTRRARGRRGARARRLTAAGVVLQRAGLHAQRGQRAQLLDGHVRLLPAPQPHLRGGVGRAAAGRAHLAARGARRLRAAARASPRGQPSMCVRSRCAQPQQRRRRALPKAPSPMILERVSSPQSMSHLESMSAGRSCIERESKSVDSEGCRQGAHHHRHTSPRPTTAQPTNRCRRPARTAAPASRSCMPSRLPISRLLACCSASAISACRECSARQRGQKSAQGRRAREGPGSRMLPWHRPPPLPAPPSAAHTRRTCTSARCWARPAAEKRKSGQLAASVAAGSRRTPPSSATRRSSAAGKYLTVPELEAVATTPQLPSACDRPPLRMGWQARAGGCGGGHASGMWAAAAAVGRGATSLSVQAIPQGMAWKLSLRGELGGRTHSTPMRFNALGQAALTG